MSNLLVTHFFLQMLADVDFGVSSLSSGRTMLADDSTLCAKKDIIIAKFDQLLKKLGVEVRSDWKQIY